MKLQDEVMPSSLHNTCSDCRFLLSWSISALVYMYYASGSKAHYVFDISEDTVLLYHKERNDATKGHG